MPILAILNAEKWLVARERSSRSRKRQKWVIFVSSHPAAFTHMILKGRPRWLIRRRPPWHKEEAGRKGGHNVVEAAQTTCAL